MANNAAQNLKAAALTAQAAQAAANAIKYGALITRLTGILVAEANKGLETFTMKDTDVDFKDWSSTIGLNYLKGPGRMLQADVITFGGGSQALQISWSNPQPDPVP